MITTIVPMSRSNNIIATTALYESKEKIYPRETKGRFQRIRSSFVLIILFSYYGLVWLQWDGHQAVLFDLPARKFYIFSMVFWPQDFFLLSWFLIISALSLFLFTALIGRVWCGYSCPQTVWTEIFVWIERWVEGGRSAQIKLDKSNWNKKKAIKKTIKHSLWVVLALLTGFTFVGYFTPIRELSSSLILWTLGPWEMFWVFFYSFATWGNAGFLREQVCIYMCPYARFQSVMFDKDTLLVSYDKKRGEPRSRGKKRKKKNCALNADFSQKPISSQGDCIDCSLCVQVCPTGIDIRDGLQYECIACGACIDACNSVMQSIQKPKGLIRFTTEHELENKVSQILRPRIYLYLVILGVFVIGFLLTLGSKSPVDVDIIRDRNSLYRYVDEKTVENIYNFKLMNKSNLDKQYMIRLENDFNVVLVNESNITRKIKSGEIANVLVKAQIPLSELSGPARTIVFNVSELDKQGSISHTFEEKTSFLSPVN